VCIVHCALDVLHNEIESLDAGTDDRQHSLENWWSRKASQLDVMSLQGIQQCASLAIEPSWRPISIMFPDWELTRHVIAVSPSSSSPQVDRGREVTARAFVFSKIDRSYSS
jgi:hypothetical protein